MITYKQQQTIATLLTNYEKLAHEVNNEEGISSHCGKCLLCKDTMVKKTRLVILKTRKTILRYMRRNVVNAKSSMSARQSRPFRKDGAFTDTSGRVKSQMMLVIEQKLNYITPKNTKIEKRFKRSFFNYLCRHR